MSLNVEDCNFRAPDFKSAFRRVLSRTSPSGPVKTTSCARYRSLAEMSPLRTAVSISCSMLLRVCSALLAAVVEAPLFVCPSRHVASVATAAAARISFIALLLRRVRTPGDHLMSVRARWQGAASQGRSHECEQHLLVSGRDCACLFRLFSRFIIGLPRSPRSLAYMNQRDRKTGVA